MIPANLKKLIKIISIILQFSAGLLCLLKNRQKNTKKQSWSVPNSFFQYFKNKKKGSGIWKWRHYFQLYETHLKKYKNKNVVLLEIGIYSGGSLEMWRAVLGNSIKIIGLDIEPACKTYEKKGFKIFIGDQAKNETWKQIFKKYPKIDILIDDGSHKAQDQIDTFFNVFPRLQPGGTMIFEDVHGENNGFAAFCHGLAIQLNYVESLNKSFEQLKTNSIQKFIRSISFYPFAIVFERNYKAQNTLQSLKTGTQWAPFLDSYFNCASHPTISSLSFSYKKIQEE